MLDEIDLNKFPIGSALSKKRRSSPEVFRAGHNRDIDRDRKPRKTNLWHPGYGARWWRKNEKECVTLHNTILQSFPTMQDVNWSSKQNKKSYLNKKKKERKKWKKKKPGVLIPLVENTDSRSYLQ